MEKAHVEIEAEGKAHFQFTPGDVIKDIVITIDEKGMKTIEGKIIPNDGKFPMSFNIIARQSYSARETKVNDDGTFKVTRLSLGELMLFIKSEKIDFQSNLFGTFQGYEYAPVAINYAYPSDKDVVYMNINFEKSGFIEGVLQNNNSEAISGMKLVATSNTDPNAGTSAYSNESGSFLLQDIPANHIFTIVVENPKLNKIIKSFKKRSSE